MKNKIFLKLKNILPEVKENVPLAEQTTLKIGGKARYFFAAKAKKDLIRAAKTAKDFKLPFFILGGGSNLLVSDKGYKGLIIKIQIANCKLQKKTLVYTEAGAKLSDIVNFLTEKSLAGLEWAAGIPGTVGGAIYGNVGAFGPTMTDVVSRVGVVDAKNLTIKELPKSACQFSNKKSVFKEKRNFIIIDALLKLKKGKKQAIKKKMEEYLNYREKNHPLAFPSAGCVFQNCHFQIKNKAILKQFPELKIFNQKKMIPSAYLIEKCGLKGKTIGNAQISRKHANFIINLGGARAEDVIKLIKLAKQKVKNKFGILLKEEIQFLGF